MYDELIPKGEWDLLSAAIDKITSSEVLEKALTDRLPITNDLTDSNKIYYGKVSMLFVDMRESTKLPEQFNADQLVKIYRSYVRAVVQAIRYSGGVVRDFMGDGILAAFIDDNNGTSEEKAVRAARYIATVIDKLINPILDKVLKHRISCGIGIHTGSISLSKVGMRGREQQNDVETEFGIAWIGNSTNLACKFSNAVDNSTIFISASTYIALSDMDKKQRWEKVQILKGNNILEGYISKHFYLQLQDEIAPCTVESSSITQNLSDILQREYQSQLSNIMQMSKELGKKDKVLEERTNRLNNLLAELKQKEEALIKRKQDLLKEQYDFYLDVLDSGFCNTEYVLAMGIKFWEDYLSSAINAGALLGKSRHQVQQQISYAMVSIYKDLRVYEKAYDFLVEQATGCSWLNLSTVQNIVSHVKYSDRLKSALYLRLSENDLSFERRKEFKQIKDWLSDYEA